MSRAIARRRRNGISGLNKARINPLNRRPLPAVLGAMSGASGAMMNPTPTILQGLVQVGIGALILNSFDERGIFSSFFGVGGVVGGTLTTVQAIGRGTGMMQGTGEVFRAPGSSPYRSWLRADRHRARAYVTTSPDDLHYTQADRSGDSRGASAQGFSPVGETAEQAYRRRMKQAVSRY